MASPAYYNTSGAPSSNQNSSSYQGGAASSSYSPTHVRKLTLVSNPF